MSGLFQFCVMPFGLTNVPSTFERLMDKVFKGLNPEICLLYLDDIIVKSTTFEDHIQNLRVIFHPYLWGVPFLVRSDHGSLRRFLNFKNLEGQLGRWNEILGSYNFTLVQRSGKLHNNADSLSRRPCHRCDFCEKIERKSTEEEVGIQCECRQVKDQSSIVNWIEGKTSEDISQAQDQDPGWNHQNVEDV